MTPKITESVGGSGDAPPPEAKESGGRSLSGRAFWVCAAITLVWLVLANVLAPGVAAATEPIGGTAVLVGMFSGSVWTVSFVFKTAFGHLR